MALKDVEDIIHFKCTYGNILHTAWIVEVYLKLGVVL